MILAIDAGNTTIVLGGLIGGEVRFTASLAADKNKTADEYKALFYQMATMHQVDLAAVKGAILSCVVPSLTDCFTQAILGITGKKPRVVGPGTKTGLNILLDDPAQMGSDLVCIAVGAKAHYPLPAITVDFGTATVLGVLDADGNYAGGALCPGFSLSLEALAAKTSKLPTVTFSPPKKVIGRETSQCLQSGFIYGFSAMIDGMIARIEEEIGPVASVVFTGDGAEIVCKQSKHKNAQLDPHLILKGLWEIYERN